MTMRSLVKIILLILPLAEIAVFIWVGKHIGIGWTIILVLLSTLLGIGLMRDQGFKLMKEFSEKARLGQAEPSDVIEGSFIFIGGILLIIPGFITSIIGLLCFIPVLRNPLTRAFIIALARRSPADPNTQGRIIEGKVKK